MKPRAGLWLVLRFLLHGAFLGLCLVWLVQPASPSRFLRRLLVGLVGGTLLVVLVPRTRRGLVAVLRRRIRIVDILVANLLLLLLIGEGGLRIASVMTSSRLLVAPDARAQEMIRSWRGLPGSRVNGITLNSGGFPDEEFVEQRREGVRRVLALGDSFSVGIVPYPRNYLTLLEQRLSRSVPTEVLNLGIAGIGPGEQLHLYRTEARYLRPDLVLLCFFVGNDFETRRPSSLLHGDSLYLVTVARRLWGLRAGTRRIARNETAFSTSVFERIERGRLEICRRQPSRRTRDGYERTFAVLEELIEETGDRLRIVIIPDEYQVNDELYASIAGGHEAEFDRRLPQRKLIAFLEAHGVPHLDLLEPLRRAEAQGRTYAPRDTHWNEWGNLVAVEHLAPWLGSELEGLAGEVDRQGAR